jgi:hypothetical protein
MSRKVRIAVSIDEWSSEASEVAGVGGEEVCKGTEAVGIDGGGVTARI